ncbi:MAG: alpha/beta hydrolase [Acidimicrobiia bacterium]
MNSPGGARPSPPSLLDRAYGGFRAIEKRLARYAPLRMSAAIPRTARYIGRALGYRARQPQAGYPRPALSPTLLAQVAMDEAILLGAMGPNKYPRRHDYERVSTELHETRELFDERGWIADPTTYHRTPPPIEHTKSRGGWALGLGYERFSLDSGYEPHPDEPGRDRWLAYEANRQAHFAVLRHQDGPRPWLVCVHGFGMGYAFMDIVGFKVRKLHRDLGLNVVMPVLPMHGPRKATRFSGEEFLSFDLVDTVHGLAQAIWDLRRVLGWVRGQDPLSVGVYGISLGGYVSALLSGLDSRADYVIAGVPVVDFPALYSAHAPYEIRMRCIEHHILSGNAEQVHRVVSPLAVTPRIPRDERFIYAGSGDRMATPEQAMRLWSHWDEPLMEWYPGNHVGFLWSGAVDAFVREALDAAGALVSAPAERAS